MRSNWGAKMMGIENAQAVKVGAKVIGLVLFHHE